LTHNTKQSWVPCVAQNEILFGCLYHLSSFATEGLTSDFDLWSTGGCDDVSICMQASLLAQSAEASAKEAAAAGSLANTALAKAASVRAVQAYNEVTNTCTSNFCTFALQCIRAFCIILPVMQSTCEKRSSLGHKELGQKHFLPPRRRVSRTCWVM
jgi:hypothetical protein